MQFSNYIIFSFDAKIIPVAVIKRQKIVRRAEKSLQKGPKLTASLASLCSRETFFKILHSLLWERDDRFFFFFIPVNFTSRKVAQAGVLTRENGAPPLDVPSPFLHDATSSGKGKITLRNPPPRRVICRLALHKRQLPASFLQRPSLSILWQVSLWQTGTLLGNRIGDEVPKWEGTFLARTIRRECWISNGIASIMFFVSWTRFDGSVRHRFKASRVGC